MTKKSKFVHIMSPDYCKFHCDTPLHIKPSAILSIELCRKTSHMWNSMVYFYLFTFPDITIKQYVPLVRHLLEMFCEI